jgi:GNAT superfamily N-acetyltransferase
MLIAPQAARTFLERDRDTNLMHLGALLYDPVEAYLGAQRNGQLVAVALVVDLAANLPDDRPTVMVAADDAEALALLIHGREWPAQAIWCLSDLALTNELEHLLGRRCDARRGLRYYTAAADAPIGLPNADLVRRITIEDADTLDLAPCALSPTALRNWLRRGWRVFGAVRSGALLCHALAAYPIGDTEEISAVFTAPQARRQGLARAVVAATLSDIRSRRQRPVYIAAVRNLPSRRLAEGLGMTLLYQTSEIMV